MSDRILRSGLEGAFPSFPAADDQLERVPTADRVDSLGREDWGEIGAQSLPQSPELKRALLPTTAVHPVVIKIALSAVVWFLAVTCLNFTGGAEVDFTLAVVTGFFVMFFTLLLLTASMVVDDPRWKQPKASFSNFLNGDRSIDAIPSISRKGLFLGLFAQGVQCVPSRCLSVEAARRRPRKGIGSALGVEVEIHAQLPVVRVRCGEGAQHGRYQRGRQRFIAPLNDARQAGN
jgi:hypothetical protein